MKNKVPTAEEFYDEVIDQINIPREHWQNEIISLIRDYKNQCLEAFAEDIKENGRTTSNCGIWNCEGESIDKSSIDEIKQKYIDKL